MDNTRLSTLDYRTAGLVFANQHSVKNFGARFKSHPKIGMPNKIKNEKRATLSNYTYDFSLLYGHQVFSDRIIEVSLMIYDRRKHNEIEIQFRKTQIINWLMQPVGRQRLTFDHVPGFYFMAEVVDKPVFSHDNAIGLLEVKFIAYPFMIDDTPEHKNIYWDSFRFATDVLQNYKYKIIGSQLVKIYNAGTSHIVPVIESSQDCTVLLRGDLILIKKGRKTYQMLVLAPGNNEMMVTGNTEIEFQYNKELI